MVPLALRKRDLNVELINCEPEGRASKLVTDVWPWNDFEEKYMYFYLFFGVRGCISVVSEPNLIFFSSENQEYYGTAFELQKCFYSVT